ncbi:MAG: hypothetical protein AAF745_14370, partial [Planctomycetota bacterium]
MSDTVLLTDDHPVDPDDELLVAYLDSELSDQMRIDVEQRLVADIEFRTRLQTLQTGWDWLDDLPDELPSEKLVESTIELVVADIDPAQQENQPWLARHRRTLIVIGLLVGGLVTGLASAMVVQRIHLRNELLDLAVAEDYQAYLLPNDFEFFRELANNPQWTTMM